MRKSALPIGIVALVVIGAIAFLLSGGLSGGGEGRTDSQALLAQGEGVAPPSKDEKSGPDLQDAAPQAAASADRSATEAGAEASLPQPAVAERKITRTATLELTVDEVAAAVQKVESAALSAGGFVSASTVFTAQEPEENERQRQTATVTIRVPAEAYPSVMNQLRGIAREVKSEKSQASEVTEQYADLEARLRNLQATEARYLELLGKAQGINEILNIQDRINSVRLSIEQTQGRLNVLNDLTDLATITVELYPPVAPAQTISQQNWAEEAWSNAWNASKDAIRVLGAATITLGVAAIWLLIPALVVAWGWRRFGPRREGESNVPQGHTGAS